MHGRGEGNIPLLGETITNYITDGTSFGNWQCRRVSKSINMTHFPHCFKISQPDQMLKYFHCINYIIETNNCEAGHCHPLAPTPFPEIHRHREFYIFGNLFDLS